MQEFPLIATIAAGFTAAWILGLITQWLRLSPIVGYLLAGVAIGPYTPGFQGDLHLAHQLAEVGVILLMFGVGLHFHLSDLLAVKSIAIPGALGQSLVATAASVAVFSLFGLEWRTGAVIGMAIAVASTVVLMRVLMDAHVLSSPAGHIAVGWLLVEDVLTVIVLVIIPVMGDEAASADPTESKLNPAVAIGMALLKLIALVGIVIVAGGRIIPWALTQVARLRSRELFTLTVMVFSIAMAAGAYALFGASMALGAFLAGMMVAQSPVSHQAAADALPLRDAFAVLFFVSVGMLFDPGFLVREPLMMAAALALILLIKPLIALVIVAALGYSSRAALTVALGLAQIGEFSFILSDLARKHHLMPESGHNLLVGGAILSITLNPLLFRSLDRIENWLHRRPRLWKLLNARAERMARRANRTAAHEVTRHATDGKRMAVVVGFGPVGQTVNRLLTESGLTTVVIDMNMDTVTELRQQGQTAIFGDASRNAILESSGIERATHLVLTLPGTSSRAAIVAAARSMNAGLRIFVRARYLREREELEQVGATAAIFEEAEAAVALSRLVLAETGAGRESIEHAVREIRTRLILDNVSKLREQPVRNIMIPWTRVRRLKSNASLDEVRRTLSEQRFSRWPVVQTETGMPNGYLLAKDLIGLGAGASDWACLVRPVHTVAPEDDVESTLQRFQKEGTTLCIVSDGNVPLGLVTVEDILEQVIGRIEDEYPRHPTIRLHELIHVDDALLDLSSESAQEAIAEMAARIPVTCGLDAAKVADLAIARERELSTNLGFGIAVPHARYPGLTAPLVIFGRSRSGIEFDRKSAEVVKLVFLLVTPADQPQLQVLILGAVAGIAGDAGLRQKLLDAATAGEIVEVLRSAGQAVAE